MTKFISNLKNIIGSNNTEENITVHKKSSFSHVKKTNTTNYSNKKEIDNLANYYWHGPKLESPDWSSWSHTVALSINKGENNPLIWAGLNAYSKSIDFYLPKSKSKWLKIIDTNHSETTKPVPITDTFIKLDNRSSVLIISEEVFGTKNNII